MRISERRMPWVTLAVTGMLIAGALAAEPVKEALSLGGGFGGEQRWWQVLTCHTVHFGRGHLWRDLPALVVLGCLLEARCRPALLAILALGAWTVPAAVLLCEPQILPYRGSSGLVVALFATVSADTAFRRKAGPLPRLAALAALVALTAKIWFEVTDGRLMEMAGGETVVVSWSAHLAGAMVGLFVSLATQERAQERC